MTATHARMDRAKAGVEKDQAAIDRCRAAARACLFEAWAVSTASMNLEDWLAANRRDIQQVEPQAEPSEVYLSDVNLASSSARLESIVLSPRDRELALLEMDRLQDCRREWELAFFDAPSELTSLRSESELARMGEAKDEFGELPDDWEWEEPYKVFGESFRTAHAAAYRVHFQATLVMGNLLDLTNEMRCVRPTKTILERFECSYDDLVSSVDYRGLITAIDREWRDASRAIHGRLELISKSLRASTKEQYPPVDESDSRILLYLLQQTPTLKMTIDIAAGADMSQRNAGDRLKSLEANGLVCTVNGKQGRTLTEQGIELANLLSERE